MPTPKPAAKRRRRVPSKKNDSTLQKLEDKRREILELYNHDVRAGQRANNYGAEDLVDRANSAYDREFMFSLSGTERALLMEIETAIERHQAGEFGRCVNCSTEIGAPRLEAVPWAKFCIDCQELSEKGLLAEP